MKNIRQTPKYAEFMQRINWNVEEVDGIQIYIKKFPFISSVMKIQRPEKLPNLKKLKLLMHKYKTHFVTVEPGTMCKPPKMLYKKLNDPYIHTKSIVVDLNRSEKEIFDSFSEAKRRAVRRAQKLGVIVSINQDIESFTKLKNKTAGIFLGFLTTRGVTRPLWNTFSPQHAHTVMASLPGESNMAGILLLIDGVTAYYWMAAATKSGKKAFAPTLCVWEALCFAKKIGCTRLDFEGVYDERYPKRSRDWQGFSKFKEGFGGTPVYYPEPFTLRDKDI